MSDTVPTHVGGSAGPDPYDVLIGRQLLGELGRLIGTEAGEFEQRFETFAGERRERTAATQLLARELGRRLYHPAGERAGERNAMLAVLSPEELYRKVEWLHGARGGEDRATDPPLIGRQELVAH
ncbi:hypothetical protein GCM10009665_80040 [Kitasatospora nipponensis]|uniref:Uncharacterized protein n=1 Tax=Kitasatospora nipponensis TaxID=258049 RepID=A0ABP4E0H4_9ACTN